MSLESFSESLLFEESLLQPSRCLFLRFKFYANNDFLFLSFGFKSVFLGDLSVSELLTNFSVYKVSCEFIFLSLKESTPK